MLENYVAGKLNQDGRQGLANFKSIYPESTKQMEQTLRAKIKIFFKSENLRKCF